MTIRDCDFEKAVKKYTPLMHKMTNNVFVTGYEKEDLMQELYMELFEALKTYDELRGATFMTYLYTRFRNRLTTLIREANKNPNEVLVEPDSDIILGAFYDDDEDFRSNDELVDAILEELDKLPRGYVTRLYLLDGLTYQEIGDMEGISKERVLFLHKRNVKRLREIFDK